MLRLIKENPSILAIISKTLDALWVLLLSVMGREIMSIHLDIHSEWSYSVIIRIMILIICLFVYSIYYNQFQKAYRIAEEKDKENLIAVNNNSNTPRKRINHYFWISDKRPSFLWFFLFAIFFVVFLYIKSQVII